LVDRTTTELEDTIAVFELLQRTSATLAAKLGLQTVLQAIADLATELSGARAGAILYRQAAHERGGFTIGAVAGAPWQAFARLHDPRLAPRLSSTVAPERVLRTGDLGAEARDPDRTAGDAAGCAVRSYLGAPLISRSGEVIARVVLGHPERDVFSARTERLIVGLAAQGASTLDNARLYEETQRASEERARLLEAERAARGALEQAGALKDQALAKLAHDLRAPLNAILGWSEILMSRLGSDAEHRNGFEVIRRNARLQAELLDALGDLNRVIAAKVAADTKPAELTAVVTSLAPDAPPPSLTGVRVLVIDDDADARDLVRMILVDAKADAITAGSADEGLALLRQIKPDVIVSDIGMAMRDGYQFIRLVRTMAPADGGRIPALALTGFVQAEDRVRALLAGYQDHISKPVKAGQLIEAVHRLAPTAP
jgi:CheY-like chemotaxis protein/GAF domain-containing protein